MQKTVSSPKIELPVHQLPVALSRVPYSKRRDFFKLLPQFFHVLVYESLVEKFHRDVGDEFRKYGWCSDDSSWLLWNSDSKKSIAFRRNQDGLVIEVAITELLQESYLAYGLDPPEEFEGHRPSDVDNLRRQLVDGLSKDEFNHFRPLIVSQLENFAGASLRNWKHEPQFDEGTFTVRLYGRECPFKPGKMAEGIALLIEHKNSVVDVSKFNTTNLKTHLGDIRDKLVACRLQVLANAIRMDPDGAILKW